MEVLAAIGLVGNIVQFVDFSSKLVSRIAELYQSTEGALADDVDLEAVTNDLALLSVKLQSQGQTEESPALERLSKSCNEVATDLLTALNKVKVNGKHQKRESIWKALRRMWSRDEISKLERRLAMYRDQLSLQVAIDLRDHVTKFMLEQSELVDGLDSKMKAIANAFVNQENIFNATHNIKHPAEVTKLVNVQYDGNFYGSAAISHAVVSGGAPQFGGGNFYFGGKSHSTEAEKRPQ